MNVSIIFNNIVLVGFDYDAFVNIINQTGSLISNFRYKGYYYDTDIELYYLKSRFYNPVLLRFITPDSIEYLDSSSVIGLNLYCYCYNNPIMYVDDMGNLPVPVDVITSIIGYSADLYSFGLKMSLKSMPELSMAVAKKMARKAGHIQSARSYIRARHSNIVKTQNLSKGAKNFSKHFGRAVLVADILWSVGENYVSGDPNWVSDSLIDVGTSVGIYALGCIPYVGWALAIGATILTEVFDDEIEEFKDWFAEGWNDFWSFSWAN